MTGRENKEQMDSKETDAAKRSRDTHSGTPNAVDPNETRNNEHQSGYGGEGGDPKTSSHERPERQK
jgi:hypothetical protein